MASNIAISLYGLSASELRELILVLCMEKKAKDTVAAHIGVMRGASADSQYPATPISTHSKVAVENDPFETPSSAASSLGERHPLPSFLMSPIQPGKVTKTPTKGSKKKLDQPLSIKLKRTPLYHNCQHCHKAFKQQDNGVYACWHHPGQLVDTVINADDEQSLRRSPRAKYSCCGSSKDSLGCRYGRHVAESTPDEK